MSDEIRVGDLVEPVPFVVTVCGVAPFSSEYRSIHHRPPFQAAKAVEHERFDVHRSRKRHRAQSA
jgi:hypothetical protein